MGRASRPQTGPNRTGDSNRLSVCLWQPELYYSVHGTNCRMLYDPEKISAAGGKKVMTTTPVSYTHLNQSTTIAYPAGIILAAVFLGIFIHATKKPMKAAA